MPVLPLMWLMLRNYSVMQIDYTPENFLLPFCSVLVRSNFAAAAAATVIVAAADVSSCGRVLYNSVVGGSTDAFSSQHYFSTD